MKGFTYEEERLTRTYDFRLFLRLLRFIQPYWKIMVFVFILLMSSAVLDIVMPYITKMVIDLHIVPPYRVINFKEEEKLRNEFLKRYSGKYNFIGDYRYLVRKSNLSKGDFMVYEKKKLIEKEMFIEVEPKTEGAIKVGNHYFVPLSAIKNFPVQKIFKIRGRDVQGIKTLTLFYLLVLVLSGILTYLHMVILTYIGQRVMVDLRMHLFKHTLGLPMKFFDRTPIGRVVTRMTNDVQSLNEFFTSVFVNLLKDFILIIGILIIMLKMNFRVTLIVLSLSPFLIFATNIFRKKVREAYREVRRKLAYLNAFLQENLSGIRVIQIYRQEKQSEEKFKDINVKLFGANIKQVKVFAVFRPIVDIVGSLALALLLLYGGINILQGGFTLGALVAFMTYIQMFFRPVMDLSEKYNLFQQAMAASERINILMDEKREDKGKGKIADGPGDIVFDDVWLRYDDETWVLKGVSFKVNSGEKVALVGPTGAGKTSIIGALLRFYPIQKGRILVDGMDIIDWNLFELRRRIGLVLQDVFIFAGDFMTNIRLQEKRITPEVVRNSARRVFAHQFIENRGNGYYEEVKERGATLSTGQRQLLSFARALSFDPKILILDEATSSVDSYTEHLIQEGLKELLKGRTSLIIAHRLSTIQDADKVVVIHRGKVVEEGNHRELLERKGLYARLWEIQVREKEFL